MIPSEIITARFWSLVDKRGADDCWLWKIKPGKNGYGLLIVKFKGEKVTVTAHRKSYELHFGPIPTGLIICHKRQCQHRNCVNPNHLYAGSYKDNLADAIAAGTIRPKERVEERNPRHKLTKAQVLEIRGLWSVGQHTLKSIAQKYGVAAGTIQHIVNGINWSTVPGGPRGGPRRKMASNSKSLKLTANDVETILSEYSGERGQMADLARRFGVSLCCVQSVVLRNTWKWVNIPVCFQPEPPLVVKVQRHSAPV